MVGFGAAYVTVLVTLSTPLTLTTARYECVTSYGFDTVTDAVPWAVNVAVPTLTHDATGFSVVNVVAIFCTCTLTCLPANDGPKATSHAVPLPTGAVRVAGGVTVTTTVSVAVKALGSVTVNTNVNSVTVVTVGATNVGFDVVEFASVTGGPPVCTHANVTAPAIALEPDPSRATEAVADTT